MTEEKNPQDFRETLITSARLLQQNEPKEAELLLEPLYERAPTNPDVAINLGGAYILRRKWRKAVEVLSTAAEANPDNAMLWMNLAAAELGSLELAGPQHQERALAAYARALEADPQAPNVHYHMGLIRKERGELAEAAAMFQAALAVNPADRDAQRWLNRVQQAMAESEAQGRDASDRDAAEAAEDDAGRSDTNESGA